MDKFPDLMASFALDAKVGEEEPLVVLVVAPVVSSDAPPPVVVAVAPAVASLMVPSAPPVAVLALSKVAVVLSGRRRSDRDVGGKKVSVLAIDGDSRKRTIDGSSKEGGSKKSRGTTPLPTEVISHAEEEEAVFQPFEHSFSGKASDCGDLFRLFRVSGDDSEVPPMDDPDRAEWYVKYARHTIIASKYLNRLVESQSKELLVVKAELADDEIRVSGQRGDGLFQGAFGHAEEV